MPSERNSRNPPRKASAALVESRRFLEARDRIVEGMRKGTQNLVDAFFDGAGKIVHDAILHVSKDLYEDGKVRGGALATLLFLSYLDELDAKHATDGFRDTRREYARPRVTPEELRASLARRSDVYSIDEVRTLCARFGVPVDLTPAAGDP